MRNTRTLAVVLMTVVALVDVTHTAERGDASRHAITFVGVDQGVALEVLDWGGTLNTIVQESFGRRMRWATTLVPSPNPHPIQRPSG
jgi:hypothetical protein